MTPKTLLKAKHNCPGLAEFEVVQLSLKDVLKLLEKEDRVTVIMMDSALDLFLAALIGTAFQRRDKEVQSLFGQSNDGPLCSMTGKASLAYALGLIDKVTLNDLKNLHKIRNRFAHSIKPDFKDRDIAKAAKKLSTAKAQKLNADNYLEFWKHAAYKCIEYIGARYDERAGEGPLARAARSAMQPHPRGGD